MSLTTIIVLTITPQSEVLFNQYHAEGREGLN